MKHRKLALAPLSLANLSSKFVLSVLAAVACLVFVGLASLWFFPLRILEGEPQPTAATASREVGPDSTQQSLAVLPQTKKAVQQQVQLLNGVDASADEWPTEAMSEAATAQLKKLVELAPGPFRPDQLMTLVTEDVVCQDLRPAELVKAYDTPSVQVLRGSNQENGPVRRGPKAVASALNHLFQSIQHGGRLALKIVRIQQSQGGFDTVVHAEGGGETGSGRMQFTASWLCHWNLGETNPRITRLALADYEEVESRQGTRPWLVDMTGSVLGDADGYRDQLLYGMDYWVNRLEHRLYVNRLGHHGLAVGDIDNDGLEDIYVCQPGGLPNRLYKHQPDGTAKDVSRDSGVDFLDDTTSALFVDLDNDGDQDLALLTVSGGYVLSNNGHGNFVLRATMPDCRNTFSLTAADYDADGWVDLYIGRYWPEESVRGAIPLPVPYYDALNGGANVLLKNSGNWGFVDVTRAVGLDVDNTRYTMAAGWEDYDNDGDQDLYVANDFGRNCLYRNDGGRFVNVAAPANVEDTAAGMSVSWADYNHDGNMDLYVGNMFSSAGNRITYQRQYAEEFDEQARAKLQRLARGNALFRNLGSDQFQDVSLQSAVTMGRWAWGSIFSDFNNDSWDDLVVANGHITTEDTGDL